MTTDPTDDLNVEVVGAAIDAVLEWHGTRSDKTGAPSLGHLLQVAGLAIKYRPGDTTIAVAALLHDAIEDVEDVDEAIVARRFGPDVARIVVDCSDSVEGARDAGDWCARKRSYLARLADKSDAARFVSLCDKVANARALELDLMAADSPRDFFRLNRFNNPDPAEQLWYYSGLADAFQAHPPEDSERLVRELRRAVLAMQTRLAIAPQPCS